MEVIIQAVARRHVQLSILSVIVALWLSTCMEQILSSAGCFMMPIMAEARLPRTAAQYSKSVPHHSTTVTHYGPAQYRTSQHNRSRVTQLRPANRIATHRLRSATASLLAVSRAREGFHFAHHHPLLLVSD